MATILNWPQFPTDLTLYETKLAEWEDNIRKWETLSGDTFNESMKKALYVDKAPMTVNTLLQVQNLDDFASMKGVTLQFLQSNAEYVAGVPTSHSQKRRDKNRDPNAMEVDALTRRGKGAKGKDKKGSGKGKSKDTDRTHDVKDWVKDASCWTCGRK